jgi:hypothetical protein
MRASAEEPRCFAGRGRRSRIFHDATVIGFGQVGGDGFPGV